MEISKIISNYDLLESGVLTYLERLPSNLKFHNLDHTRDVLNSASENASRLGISSTSPDFWTIRTGALFHDVGYVECPKDHEEVGARTAYNWISRDYGKEYAKIIAGIVLATKMPQDPKTLLEKVVCDADVDNFGRDDFFEKGTLLRQELESMGIKKTDKAWYEGVLKLLENHSYHTIAARELRNEKKMQNIEKLKQIIASLH